MIDKRADIRNINVNDTSTQLSPCDIAIANVIGHEQRATSII